MLEETDVNIGVLEEFKTLAEILNNQEDHMEIWGLVLYQI